MLAAVQRPSESKARFADNGAEVIICQHIAPRRGRLRAGGKVHHVFPVNRVEPAKAIVKK